MVIFAAAKLLYHGGNIENTIGVKIKNYLNLEEECLVEQEQYPRVLKPPNTLIVASKFVFALQHIDFDCG